MNVFKKIIVAVALAGTLANGLDAVRFEKRGVGGCSTKYVRINDDGSEVRARKAEYEKYLETSTPWLKKICSWGTKKLEQCGTLIVQSCLHPKKSITAALCAYLAEKGIQESLSFSLPLRPSLIKGIGGVVFGFIAYKIFKSLLPQREEQKKRKTEK